MICKTLTPEELRPVFETHLKEAFPPSLICIPNPFTAGLLPTLWRIWESLLPAFAMTASYCLRKFSSVAILSIFSSSMSTTILLGLA